MRKYFKYLIIVCLYACMYMMLKETFSLKIFMLGLFISIIALVVTDKLLLKGSYVDSMNFNIFKFLLYTFYLMIQILKAGFNTALLIISGKVKHQVFEYESKLEDEFLLNLLCNSITLTPGTITINREGSVLKIMQLCKQKLSCDIKDVVAFENKIIKIKKSSKKKD